VISCAWKFGVHALECFDVSGLGKRGTRRRQTTDDRRMETIVTKKMRDAGSLFASDCMEHMYLCDECFDQLKIGNS